MSWSSWAKTLAKEAQRGIDIVLDINEDPNAAGQPDRTSTEIGSTENKDTLLPTAHEENNEPVSRKGKFLVMFSIVSIKINAKYCRRFLPICDVR